MNIVMKQNFLRNVPALICTLAVCFGSWVNATAQPTPASAPKVVELKTVEVRPTDIKPVELPFVLDARAGRGQSIADFNGLARDVCPVLYEAQTGLTVGDAATKRPGMIAFDSDPTYFDQHYTKLLVDIKAKIPDPTWSGFAVLDFELWPATYSLLKMEPNQLVVWDAYWTAKKSTLTSQQGYDAVARRFYEGTLRIAQQFRPNVKWGYYGYPARNWWAFLLKDVETKAKSSTDELAWLWAAQDAFYPHLYVPYVSAEVAGSGTVDRVWQHRSVDWILNETVRVASDKPIVPFVWFMYEQPTGDGVYGTRFLTPEDFAAGVLKPLQIRAPRGIAVWDWLPDAKTGSAWRDYYNKTAQPLLKAAIEPRPAP